MAGSSVSVNDLGRQAYQKILFKDYPSAIEILNKAIRLYPREKELYNNRSLCYYHLQNYNLALQDSQYLYVNYPTYIKSLFQLCVLIYFQSSAGLPIPVRQLPHLRKVPVSSCAKQVCHQVISRGRKFVSRGSQSNA
uniref:Tetratricopeptide repeat protein n=1 Tax=Cacopsylla melanoneura TaxID=428564 RepID=A0A8D8YBK5_9HEMI